jgi:hypothetical protein
MVWTAVVLIAGCSSKKARQAEVPGTQAGADAVQADVPRVRMPYVIAEAGVHFNPPLSWDPDRIQVVTLSGQDAAATRPGSDYVVSFNYRAEQPAHRNASLLNLYVMHRSNPARATAGAEEVVDSTGEWVYVASLPHDNPYRAGLLDADQFDSMRMTMVEVRDAFSTEAGGPTDLRAESKRR